MQPIPEGDAERVANELVEALSSADMQERRGLVVQLVRQVTLAPRQGMVYLELQRDPLDLEAPTLYAMSGDRLVPPTGFEPVPPP